MTNLKDVTLPTDSANWTSWGNVIDSELRLRASSVWQIDGFPGADDNAKFGNALAAASAVSNHPTLQFPPRYFGPLTTTRTPFSGMRLQGPDGNSNGVKNLEISGGVLVNHRVRVQSGNGLSSLFVQTGDLHDVVIDGIAFSGSSSAQFWHQTGGSLYPTQWHSLSFDGFQSVTGSGGLVMTQGLFSGHWTVLNYRQTPLVIKGADCSLWLAGYLNSNSPASVAGAGMPIIHLDYLEKSTIGYMFITAENDWTGLRFTGSVSRDVRIFGGTFEGRASTNPATRPVVDMVSGSLVMFGPRFSYVAAGSNSVGVVRQSGGRLVLSHPAYQRAGSTAEAFPLLYQTGGTALVDYPQSLTAGERIRVRWSSGTTDTAAAPSNRVVA